MKRSEAEEKLKKILDNLDDLAFTLTNNIKAQLILADMLKMGMLPPERKQNSEWCGGCGIGSNEWENE